MNEPIYGCSGCATSGGRLACLEHGRTYLPGPGVAAVFGLHQHQWRTDEVTAGWLWAIQTCAVLGCGIVRRVAIEQGPAIEGSVT